MSIMRDGMWLVWEAPQTILGGALLVVLTLRGRIVKVEREDGRLVVETRGTGVSLDHVVFWCRESNRARDVDERVRAHELGHARQSRLLGWLYLLLVGIPSISRVGYAILYREVTGRVWTHYYDGYPESWADRLGGVMRDDERAG